MVKIPVVYVKRLFALLYPSPRSLPRTRKKMRAVDYWREHRDGWPPVLGALAQAVFGAPSSAGCVERDFCVADMFVPCKRGGLDPANLEMSLYLRGQMDSIPLDIPKLSDAEAANAIPDRLTDPAKLAEVKVLDFLPEFTLDAEDEEDLSWADTMQPLPSAAGGASAGTGGL